MKRCPLQQSRDTGQVLVVDCAEEKCALWHNTDTRCIIKSALLAVVLNVKSGFGDLSSFFEDSDE